MEVIKVDGLEVIYDDDEIRIITKPDEAKTEYHESLVSSVKEKIEEYKNIFNIDKIDKMTCVIYHDYEEYKTDYREAFKSEPPVYSRGWFSAGLNTSFILKNFKEYDAKAGRNTACTFLHEIFHILYKNYVYKDTDKRIVWFDEGLAQFFSGEAEFRPVLKQFRDNRDYLRVDNINERIQGNDSVPDNLIFTRKNVFEGYTISYLTIEYLNETKGLDYIIDLMKDNEAILKLGNSDIFDEVIAYNDVKLKEYLEGRKEKEKSL